MNHSNKGRMVPWLIWATVWLLAAAALLALIRPAQLMGGSGEQEARGIAVLTRGLLAGPDTQSHDYPAAWWGWTQIRKTGEIPLWNPSWFGGEPFIASQTFRPFYPPNWLGLLLPFPLAFNIQYPLHLMLAATVMAWACRRRGLSWLAAGLAGLAWGFGGHLATLVGSGHIQTLQALTWLPMVTLGAWRIGRGQARAGVGPLAIGLALQITAGQFQIVYLTLVAAGLEWLGAQIVDCGLRIANFKNPMHKWRRLFWLMLGILVALGLSAIYWIPAAEFARLSIRQETTGGEEATRGPLPRAEAFEFVLPRLLGDSMPHGRGEEWSARPSSLYLGDYGKSLTRAPARSVSNYVGAGVLVFTLLALLMAPDARRRAAWGYALLAAGAWAISLKIIPGLAHLPLPSTSMALLSYGLVMAAAIGLDGFAHPAVTGERRREHWYRGMGSLMLLLFIFTAALMIFADRRMGMTSLARLASALTDHPDRTDTAQRIFLQAAAARHLFKGLTLILCAAGLWAWLQAMPESLAGKRAASLALLAALALGWGYDLISNARPFWNGSEYQNYQQSLTQHWAMPLWQKADEPVRYLDAGNELSNCALTLSDFSLYRSIGSGHGNHPFTYKRYTELLTRLGFYNINFLRLFNVGYLIWPTDRQRPEGFLEYQREGNRALLHNPDIHYVRPMVHARVVRDWDELMNRLATPGFNPYESTTLLAQSLSEESLKKKKVDQTQLDMHLQARVIPLGPGETLLKCRTTNKGWIIVSEPCVPGWRVQRDGPPPPHPMLDARYMPQLVDGFFQGIFLPAGRNEVRLTFDPVSQRLGLYITLLILAVAAHWNVVWQKWDGKNET